MRPTLIPLLGFLAGITPCHSQPSSNLVTGADGLSRQLHFTIDGGNLYTLEASADLISWTPENSWLSLGGSQAIRYPLFRFPAPLDTTIQPPLAIGFTLQALTPTGSFVCWKSLDDGSMKRQALPTVSPNSRWPLSPYHTRQAGSYLFSATYRGSLPHTPRNAALGPLDTAMVSTLITAIGTMNADKTANIEPIANPPVRIQDHRYWRINRSSAATLDSDGDGLKNNQEFSLGSNPLSRDTDLDGLTDNNEIFFSRNPLVNEAATHPDITGFPSSLRDGLTAFWDFESPTVSNNIITYPDAGNFAYPLTAKAGMVTGTQGLLRNAASFGGAHALTCSPNVLAGKSRFSICFWFKCNLNSIQAKAGNLNTFFFTFNDNSANTVSEFNLRAYKGINGTGQKLILSQFGVDQFVTLPVANPLDDAKWQHLAVTKSGTTFTIYRNGISLGSTTMNTNALSTTNLGFFCIGNLHPGSVIDTPFRGLIDRFCIHSRTLNSQDVDLLIKQNADGDSQTDHQELLGGVTSPFVFDP